MGWKTNGLKRTLKLKITKTEVNPNISGESPIDIIIDGNLTNFTGGTQYSWSNGLTMGRAPLMEFVARSGETVNWVKARFPLSVTSKIPWGNMRIGATYVHFKFSGGADGSIFNIELTTPEGIFIPEETIRLTITMDNEYKIIYWHKGMNNSSHNVLTSKNIRFIGYFDVNIENVTTLNRNREVSTIQSSSDTVLYPLYHFSYDTRFLGYNRGPNDLEREVELR